MNLKKVLASNMYKKCIVIVICSSPSLFGAPFVFVKYVHVCIALHLADDFI